MTKMILGQTLGDGLDHIWQYLFLWAHHYIPGKAGYISWSREKLELENKKCLLLVKRSELDAFFAKVFIY